MDIDIETDIVSSSQCDSGGQDKEIVIRLALKGDGRLKTIDSREDERFRDAMQYGVMHNVPMQELANRCCLSLSTFKRRFRQREGCSPHKWIVARRMEVASDILAKADVTISSLARMFCYNSTSHFICVFRNHFGVTPRILRQQIESSQCEGDEDANILG